MSTARTAKILANKAYQITANTVGVLMDPTTPNYEVSMATAIAFLGLASVSYLEDSTVSTLLAVAGCTFSTCAAVEQKGGMQKVCADLSTSAINYGKNIYNRFFGKAEAKLPETQSDVVFKVENQNPPIPLRSRRKNP